MNENEKEEKKMICPRCKKRKVAVKIITGDNTGYSRSIMKVCLECMEAIQRIIGNGNVTKINEEK